MTSTENTRCARYTMRRGRLIRIGLIHVGGHTVRTIPRGFRPDTKQDRCLEDALRAQIKLDLAMDLDLDMETNHD